MKKNESVTKVMSRNLTTIDEGEPVSKLRRIFEESKIHHVPVVNGEKLVGIISWLDFLKITAKEFRNQDGRELDTILDYTYRLADIMSSKPTTIPAWSTIRDAARILSTGSFHSVPVVDGDKLVGLVTSTDLINYLLDM